MKHKIYRRKVLKLYSNKIKKTFQKGFKIKNYLSKILNFNYVKVKVKLKPQGWAATYQRQVLRLGMETRIG